MRLDKASYSDGEEIMVSVDVENIGNLKGKETVQFYVRDEESSLLRPERELKAFSKVELESGEKKTVTVKLTERSLSFYDPEVGDWVSESGIFTVYAASSSRDLRASAEFSYEQRHPKYKKIYFDTQHSTLFKNPKAKDIYMDFLVEKKVIAPEDREKMIPLLTGNYMGIYNVITSLLGGNVTREELDAVLDKINNL